MAEFDFKDHYIGYPGHPRFIVNKIIEDDFVYNNFKDLIKYIQEADFIIAADSLPIHLCELFSKPHFMLFPNGHPRNFITPYALDNSSFAEFSNFKLTNLL